MLGLLLIFKATTVLMTIKITKMALVNMYLTIGGEKVRVLGYNSRIFFTVAPRNLVELHFPYFIVAIEGGNSTEAT